MKYVRLSVKYLKGGVLGCALLLCGCSGSSGIESRDGLVVSSGSGSSDGGLLAGTVGLDAQGCWTLSVPKAYPVVWPAGTEWADGTHRAVKLANGLVIRSGSYLKGGGGTTTDAQRSSVRIKGSVPCLGGGPTVSMAVISDSPLPTIATPPA